MSEDHKVKGGLIANRSCGVIKAVRQGEFCLVSSADYPEQDVLFRRPDCASACFDDLCPGDWVEFRVSEGPNGLNADDLKRHGATLAERIARGRSRYSGAMKAGRNPGSLRLDGLTMGEAKRMRKAGHLSQIDYFACMSGNGLRATASHFGVAFEDGERIGAVREIVLMQNADKVRQAPDEAIRESIQKRGIMELLHFTHITNLASILKGGILPRSLHASLDVPPFCGDDVRLDGQLDANSVSVSHTNSSVFTAMRRRQKESSDSHWVVLGLAPDVMAMLPCVFCVENAAAAGAIQKADAHGTPVDAFESLFGDVQTKRGPSARSESKCPPHWPTDQQAETLVRGIISKEYIECVYFYCDDSLENWRIANEGLATGVKLVKSRKHWFDRVF